MEDVAPHHMLCPEVSPSMAFDGERTCQCRLIITTIKWIRGEGTMRECAAKAEEFVSRAAS